MRNMYKTLYFLLSTALIIETKYCVFIPLQIQHIHLSTRIRYLIYFTIGHFRDDGSQKYLFNEETQHATYVHTHRPNKLI
jgi:hypothetical protein